MITKFLEFNKLSVSMIYSKIDGEIYQHISYFGN